MKRIIACLLIVFLSFPICSYGMENDTLSYLLEKGGFDTKEASKKYMDGKMLNDALNIIFRKNLQEEKTNYNVKTKDLALKLKEMGFDFNTEEKTKEQVLTFNAFKNILENYFYDIIKINNLSVSRGISSSYNDSYYIAYGNGKNITIPKNNLLLKEDVNIIFDNDKIVEIYSPDKIIDLKKVNLKEKCGKLFLIDNKDIYVEHNEKIDRYLLSGDFVFLTNNIINEAMIDKNIALYIGSYRKNLDVALIAVERM